jgi:hypothetical protein
VSVCLEGLARSRRAWRLLSVAGLLSGAMAGVCAAPGYAALEVIPPGDPSNLGFSAEVSKTQAGEHPDASTSFNVTPPPTVAEFQKNTGPLKDTVVDLPPGVVGNPEAVQKCTTDQLKARVGIPTDCPAGSQVGIVQVRTQFDFQTEPFNAGGAVPLYAMRPSADQLALFAFKLGSNVVTLEASVRASDNGVRLTARNALQFLPVVGATVTVWGIPSDPSHDSLRCHQANPTTHVCDGEVQDNVPFGNPGSRRTAFFTNPTVCDGPKLTAIRVSSWWIPPVDVLSDPVSDIDPTPIGCEKLGFDPSIDLRPDTTKADSPMGLSVDVVVPQSDDPDGVATSHLKDVKVVLPEGLTISPSSASGLEGCSDAQLGFGTDSPVLCPAASKIGSVVAETPVLEKPLDGSVYAGSQRSSDPESGKMFRLFVVVTGPGGLVVKLVGHVRADRRTGRLETTFENNPQLPVSKITLALKSGPRAPLAMPGSCGQKVVSAILAGWGGQVRGADDAFGVDCPGTSGFAPAFDAGTLSPKAGGFSPFLVRVSRPDGQEFMDGVALELPRGVTAKLKNVPLCPDARASAGSCGIESRVGMARVGAGPGPLPFVLDGSVSLTGPYKGAPYGLSVAVPVVAGPFDLGTVVVRQALFVDPVDAHITVVSDPLPTIVGGVPVRLRSVAVDIDRPGFVLNPTSCATKRIGGVLHSQQGSSAPVSQRFQAGDCQALEFKPRLRLKLTGRRQVADGGHPGLEASLSQRPGQANIDKVEVRLPLSLALDPSNAGGLCEFDEGQKPDPKCPKSSIIGRARAVTPLLNHPLTGNVYFVKGVRKDRRTGRLIRTLPTLLVALRGEVAINLRATTAVKRNKLVNTFAAVPDAAVSRFDLSLKGGKGGILVVTGNRNLCRGKQVANVAIGGHNGKAANGNTRMTGPCPKHKTRRRGR